MLITLECSAARGAERMHGARRRMGNRGCPLMQMARRDTDAMIVLMHKTS